jgi:enoyl-CoA hydratase/carnithine racemase
VIELRRDGAVSLLDLGEGDHRFNPDSISRIHALLDEAEAMPAPRALVTVASGKIWHNGLDLDWLGANPDRMGEFLSDVQSLLARVLVLPVPTVAVLQGHCFAAGAMFALAHDARVMRADRGFFCLPEIDINMSFPDGMAALVQSRLTPSVAHEAMTTGRRYGGTDAAALDIVGGAFAEDELRSAALEWADANAVKDPVVLGAIKRTICSLPHRALVS